MLALLLTLLLAGLALLLALLASSLALLTCGLALLATTTTTATSAAGDCILISSIIRSYIMLRRRRGCGRRLIGVALSVICKVMTLRASNRRLHFLIILDIFIHNGGGHVGASHSKVENPPHPVRPLSDFSQNVPRLP